MIRTVVALIVLLVLALPSLDAQTPDAMQRIETTRQRAAAEGIPVSLLDAKVAEGRAKGVRPDLIATAVETRLAALIRARTVMGLGEREWTPTDLSVGADALQAGVSEDVLRTLSRSAPADQRAVAIAILTHLVQLGEPPNRALGQVQAAIQQGPEALRNLPARAAAARERRGPPEGRGRPDNPGNSQGAAGRGRANAGPPASVPAPGKKPGEENPGKGKGRPPGPPGRP